MLRGGLIVQGKRRSSTHVQGVETSHGFPLLYCVMSSAYEPPGMYGRANGVLN